jgi:uncharacterized protein (DUF849 family)
MVLVVAGEVTEFHRTGQVRILAVSSPERMPRLPDLPTFAELGQPDLTAEEWFGVLLPAGAPAPIVEGLHRAIAAAAAAPELQEALARLEYRAATSSPQGVRRAHPRGARTLAAHRAGVGLQGGGVTPRARPGAVPEDNTEEEYQHGIEQGHRDRRAHGRHGVQAGEPQPADPAGGDRRVRRKAHKEGAAIAALHARRPDDQATCNADIYRRINGLIRERCDIVLNNSTGGGSSGDMLLPRPDGMFENNFEERLKGLDAGAEMATLDGFTAVDTFGDKEILVITTPSRCEAMAKRFQERGIKPEWEVFNPAHVIQDVTRLIQKGYDKPPYYINMVLGTDRNFQGGMPYSDDLLTAMVKLLPPQSVWCLSAIGPAQLPGTTRAMTWAATCAWGWRTTTTTAVACWRRNEMLVRAPFASPRSSTSRSPRPPRRGTCWAWSR